MLSKILSKDYCAKCKFCCIFEVRHLWETPEMISHLCDTYKNSDPSLEVPCPFLNRENGCTLPAEDKPFECSIWPFRIMDKNGKIIMTVADTCPGIKKYSTEFLREFARENLLTPCRNYYKEHPDVAQPFVDYYTELFELNYESGF